MTSDYQLPWSQSALGFSGYSTHHICLSLYAFSVQMFIPVWVLLSPPLARSLYSIPTQLCTSDSVTIAILGHPLIETTRFSPQASGYSRSLLLHHPWQSPPSSSFLSFTIRSSTRPMQSFFSFSSSILPLHMNQVMLRFTLLLILSRSMPHLCLHSLPFWRKRSRFCPFALPSFPLKQFCFYFSATQAFLLLPGSSNGAVPACHDAQHEL